MKKLEASAIAGLVVLAFAFGLVYSSEPQVSGGVASANIVAASQQSDTGAIGEVKVEVVPGSGDVLIETNPFVQADTQLSATKAKEVAEQYTGKSLENNNVIYTVEMNSTVVGGPSAGAAMTLATIAAMTDREVQEDAVITGTITESGRIGKVGEIPVKAYTAGSSGLESFYVPEGQSTQVNYEKVLETERRGFFTYRDVEYRPVTFNISSYTRENFDMRTREVRNIYEAADKMLK